MCGSPVFLYSISFRRPDLWIFPMKREKCPKDKKGAAPPRRSKNLLGKDLEMIWFNIITGICLEILQ